MPVNTTFRPPGLTRSAMLFDSGRSMDREALGGLERTIMIAT